MKKRMFKMNTITLVLLSFMFFSSFNCYAATLTQKLYAADGRTVIVREDYVETYLECGWYLEPMSTLYDIDGNTVVVKTSEVESYINDGWYTEPVQILYNTSGDTMIYAKKNVEEALALGWHTEMPTITVYASNGKTMDVPAHLVDEYIAWGWYIEPVQMMYKETGEIFVFTEKEVDNAIANGWYSYPVQLLYNYKGESAIFAKKDVEEALANGWYKKIPMTTIYAFDGRIASVPTYLVSDYKAVGWYTEPMATLHSLDGSTIVVAPNEVELYQDKGWYTYPVQMLYNSKGEGVVFDKNDVEWAVKEGWSVTMPKTKIYSLDGRVAEVPLDEVSEYQKVGWYTSPVEKLYNANGKTIIVYDYEVNSYLNKGWRYYPVYSKSTLLNKLNGWWVDLYSCESVGFTNGCFLNYIKFTSSKMEMGSTYSEFTTANIQSVTYLGNNTYKLSLYVPAQWFGGYYYGAEYSDFTLEYYGDNEIYVNIYGEWSAYTFIGTNHTYDSIQRDWRVVDAMNW